MPRKKTSTEVSQRQLKVAEQIRHALYGFFLNEDFLNSSLEGISITVTEVKISPDLKNSTAYVSALGGKEPEDFANILNEISPQIRHVLASKVNFRYMPKIYFKLDDSFERVAKINSLFSKT